MAGQTVADVCVVVDVLAEDPQGECWLFQTDCVPDDFRYCEDTLPSEGCCSVSISALSDCEP